MNFCASFEGASQARHEEKMRALGKPVPVYSAPRK